MKRPRTDKKALCPTRVDYRHCCYTHAEQHEQHFVDHLKESMEVSFVEEVKQLYRNVYSGPPRLFCFLCTYMTFLYQVTDDCLEITDLAFSGESYLCKYTLAIVHVLLAVCVGESLEKSVKRLEFKNAIPGLAGYIESLTRGLQDGGDILYLDAEHIIAIARPQCYADFALSRKEYLALVETGNFFLVLPDLMSIREEERFLKECLYVGDSYVYCLQNFLYQLYTFVKGWSVGAYHAGLTLRCDAVKVVLCSTEGEITLRFISVRPCLVRNRIASLVVWRLMSACCTFGVPCFAATEVFTSMMMLLLQIDDFGILQSTEDEPDKMFITLQDMCRKSLMDILQISDRLVRHEGSEYYEVLSLPAASSLNSQAD